MSALLEFALFQGAWFAAVLGAARGAPWLGLVACGLLLAYLLRGERRPGRRLAQVAGVTLLGGLLDSLQRAAGLLEFPAEAWPPVPGWLAPPWIWGLWALFGGLLGGSLAWLGQRPWLALVLGAVGGPLSFYSASRLGATALPGTPPLGLYTLALEWALLTPILARLLRPNPAPAGPTP